MSRKQNTQRYLTISFPILVLLLARCTPTGTGQTAVLPTGAATAAVADDNFLLLPATEEHERETAVSQLIPAPLPPLFTPEPTTIVHTVQAGETLYRIAINYNVPLDTLIELNNISNPTLLLIGDKLIIPPMAMATGGDESAINPTTTPFPAILIPQSSTIINGLALNEIIVMSPQVEANIRNIYAYGQSIGHNPHAFSKVGDSTIMNPGLLVQFENSLYDLGDYAHLQPTIDYFSGSFDRYGAATRVGLHAWTVLDPAWADKTWCISDENMLACELHLHNPSYLFIRLGTNDKGLPDTFNRHVREIVSYAIQNGVVPILSTKADRFEGEGNINNEILRQIAADYKIPLWEYDHVAATLPKRGLFSDGIHIATVGATYNYTDPQALQVGQSTHDLTALVALDAVWRVVTE